GVLLAQRLQLHARAEVEIVGSDRVRDLGGIEMRPHRLRGLGIGCVAIVIEATRRALRCPAAGTATTAAIAIGASLGATTRPRSASIRSGAAIRPVAAVRPVPAVRSLRPSRAVRPVAPGRTGV